MDARQLANDPRTRVALLTFLCFLLGSTGWLMWLYHLTSLADPTTVDVLTMVVGYLMQAAGMGAYALVDRSNAATNHARNVTLALVGYVACLAPAALIPNLGTTLAFGYLANVLCGFYQGHYLACLARSVQKDSRGLVFGGAYAASTLAGWLLSAVAGGALTTGLPCLAVCCALAAGAVALVRNPLPTAQEGALTGHVTESDQDQTRNLLGLAAGVVVLMSLTKNAGFGFPTTDIMAGVSLELSRLVYGVGLLAAGIVSDKDRRYGALCCAAALVTPFLMLALSGADASATILWALNYLFFGFFSVYRVLVFSDLATEAGPACIAGFGLLFGRVGDALGTGLYVALGSNVLALIAATSALFACTIVLLFLLVQRLYAPRPEHVPTEQELFDRFAMRHDLSDREREVLQQLLSRRTNAEIAAELFVSEATVKYHVRNLLRKTGCKNRRELADLYAQSKHER